MALHAKDTLGCTRIAKVFNLPLAITALEATCTEGLFAGQDGQVLDFISTGTTAIRTIVAD